MFMCFQENRLREKHTRVKLTERKRLMLCVALKGKKMCIFFCSRHNVSSKIVAAKVCEIVHVLELLTSPTK